MASIRDIGTCLGATSLFLFAQTLACQELTPDEEILGDRVYESVLGLSEGETELFSELLDMKALVDRVLSNVEVRGLVDRAFRYGLISSKADMVANISAMFATAESLTQLRSRTTRGFVTVLIRVDFGDEGLNYFEYMVDPSSGKIVDWYDYVLGHSISENIRSIAIAAAATTTVTGLIYSLFNESETHSENLTAMAKAIGEDKLSEAVDVYRQAQDSFKELDPALTLLIVAASQGGDSEADYRYALEQVARFGSDNPRFAFMLIDYYFVHEQYDETIAAVEVVQDRLDMVEAGMEEVKAGIFYARGDTDSAIRGFEHASRIEPDRYESYATLFELYAMNDQYASAQNMMDILNERFDFGVSPEDFADDPDLAGYVDWTRQRGE